MINCHTTADVGAETAGMPADALFQISEIQIIHHAATYLGKLTSVDPPPPPFLSN